VEAVKGAFLVQREGRGADITFYFHGFKGKIAQANELVKDAKKNSPFRAPHVLRRGQGGKEFRCSQR
jgi:hypothetical protein